MLDANVESTCAIIPMQRVEIKSNAVVFCSASITRYSEFDSVQN